MPERITALYGPPKVGGDTLAYCTRCKMELAHIIVSMVDSRPAKVLCKTCRTQRNFRSLDRKRTWDSTTHSSTTARAPRPTPVRVAELWEKQVGRSTGAEIRTYSLAQSYAKGERINHPKFGVGVVEEVKRNGKMVVLFRDGERVLVHGLQAASA